MALAEAMQKQDGKEEGSTIERRRYTEGGPRRVLACQVEVAKHKAIQHDDNDERQREVDDEPQPLIELDVAACRDIAP